MANLRLFESPNAAERLAAAATFLRSFPASREVLVVGASRTAVDDLVRSVCTETGSSFGVQRWSWARLAATAAALPLAANGTTPLSELGAEAMAAHAAQKAGEGTALSYFAPLAGSPGFASALASTLSELRLAAVDADRLHGLSRECAGLAELQRIFEGALRRAHLADRAALFEAAVAGWRQGTESCARGKPVLLVDLELGSPAEGRFLRELVGVAETALATVPAGDTRTLDVLRDAVEVRHEPGMPRAEAGGLHRLQTYLFADEDPKVVGQDEEIRFFSAPGESREAVEIARYVLDEARDGTPFDRMAVFLRNAEAYTPLLQTAFRRAGIPAFFARGTLRPNAFGRAFTALLRCRVEDLSPKEFADYVSFGKMPDPERQESPANGNPDWVGSADEAFIVEPGAAREAEEDDDPAAHSANTVRVPRGWARSVVETSVLGDVERWRRRLAGLEAEVRCHRDGRSEDGLAGPHGSASVPPGETLRRLHRFALPVIERVASLPEQASWGQWRRCLTDLAGFVLSRPESVLRVLAELEPVAGVGPASIEDVLRVLGPRLSFEREDSDENRYGRVFVATPAQARGRSFAVVFVPGLAERLFPQRPREDPLLPDRLRRRLSPHLVTQEERGNRERLLLRLVVGAAGKRIYFSYPRVDVVQARPRVTSFYGLDVARALHGRVPDVEEFERSATETAHARLAWPAPGDAARSIDAIEHDLSVLGGLLHDTRAERSDGRARYLLELNVHLARSLRTRFARWQRAGWSEFDGLVRRTTATEEALSAHRLAARPHMATALQRFAACPYQFFLATVHGLQASRPAASAEGLDPRTRATIFQEIQERTLRGLCGDDAETAEEWFDRARRVLLSGFTEVADGYRNALVPPIRRVWDDEMTSLRGDLLVWLRRLAGQGGPWRLWRIGFRFGMTGSGGPPDGPDAVEAVRLPHGALVSGRVDVIESDRHDNALRITDHRSGAAPARRGAVVGGGEMLQPVLHGLAVETALGRPVREARLLFDNSTGGLSERVVLLDERARRHARTVLEAIDTAIEKAFLPPAPAEGACAQCEFRPVCGPYEEERVQRKKSAPLAFLHTLRRLP